MRLMIPMNEENIDTEVCISFGRAPFYGIYDTEDDSCRFIVNKAADAQGGAGIKAAQTIIDSEADAVLTPRCGEKAAAVLEEAGIAMYKTSEEGTAKENVLAWKEGKLPVLGEFHKGLHGRGGK